MNWGWYDKVQKVIKEQTELAREREEESQQEQEENWKAIAKFFSEIRLCRFVVAKFKSGAWTGWSEQFWEKIWANLGTGVIAISFLIASIGYSVEQNPDKGGNPLWLRLVILMGLVGVVLFPFVAGKRKLLKGNITAMRLVRLDQNGNQISREAAMTRQDIQQVCSFFHGTARLFHLGGFQLGTYGILVDKDYKRKFTLYFNADDKSVFRGSRHLWTWHLSEEETNRFYEFLQKYVERLGE